MICNVTGYIYDPQGNVLTTGKLYLTLQQDMVLDGQKIAPTRIAYDLNTAAPQGYVDVDLYPTATASPAGLAYLVEFDPTPSDTTKPIYSKVGYWSNFWSVPYQASATVGSFASALRGTASNNYLPLSSPAARTNIPIVFVNTGNATLTAADTGSTVIFNSSTARTVFLPPPTPNAVFRFVINTVTSAGQHAVNTGTGVTVTGLGVNVSANTTLKAANADVIGDQILLIASSNSNWQVVDKVGTWSA